MTSFSPQVLSLIEEIQSHANPVVAEHSQRYFKTGPGEYGEGDVFIGVRVPVVRAVGKNFRDLSPAEIVELAQSPIHELRLCAVQVLAGQFKRSKNLVQQGELFDVYLSLVAQGRVNNWDLVDSCAPSVGGYLTSIDNSMDLLRELASSANLWERRSAVMFTAALIRQEIFDPTVRLCEMLLGDSHDLIHKATGWMLREVGNRDVSVLRGFLDRYAATMPRTMLRYAIEKLSEPERKHYLGMKSLLA
ncbi:DNA alkylation repair protein [Aurantimicrobium minutum]|uniref:DNA alkylation repair protein n=1 Tax=Aurantimicrobium minutum TaxID=708131 RepID=UPI0024752EE6|nr:DNA alkylation repair protein [Aurantimicrobium minutum]MDH6239129.1 3-methyladenine DNA glycosylase AlkD [Aurantimicrobium minutum]